MLSLDLHCGQIQGFFHHAPVDNCAFLKLLSLSYRLSLHTARKHDFSPATVALLKILLTRGHGAVHAFVEHVPYFVNEIVPSFQDSPIAIVSPDAGGVARAKLFMESLSAMKVQVSKMM